MPDAIRRAAPWACVVAFPVVLLAAVITGAQDPSWFPYLRYLLPFLVVALPAALLPRLPLVALGLMLLGALVVAGVAARSWEWGYPRDIRTLHVIMIDVAVGYSAVRLPTRISGYAAATALGVQFAATGLFPLSTQALPATVALTVLAMASSWVIGVLFRQRATYAAEQAVTAERLRIARELHDMVAHSISVIAIQAGVGSRVMYSKPEQARLALDAIEVTSRETVTGLRHALGVLRGGPPDLDLDRDSAPVGSAPGLDGVEQLVGTVRAAGVRMQVCWLGDRRPVPPDVDLAAFRIVQEAVTNVVRHAGVRTCQVRIDHRQDELALEVCDDGAGGAATHEGAGYGIVGMRERAGLLGGRFEAGSRPEGGFRVAAWLPLPARPR